MFFCGGMPLFARFLIGLQLELGNRRTASERESHAALKAREESRRTAATTVCQDSVNEEELIVIAGD